MEPLLATIEEIKTAGFRWPASATIQEHLVQVGDKINLTATREALLQKEIYWNKEYAKARSAIRSGGFPGAQSADEITDADSFAEDCRYAARQIEKMIGTLKK